MRSLFQWQSAQFVNWIRLHDIDDDWIPTQPRRSSSTIPPPLYYASLAGLPEISRWLLEKDTDVNVRGGQYGNALQAVSAGGHEAVVRLLLEKNADINAQGAAGRSVWQCASGGVGWRSQGNRPAAPGEECGRQCTGSGRQRAVCGIVGCSWRRMRMSMRREDLMATARCMWHRMAVTQQSSGCSGRRTWMSMCREQSMAPHFRCTPIRAAILFRDTTPSSVMPRPHP
jgi:hypothetical protein